MKKNYNLLHNKILIKPFIYKKESLGLESIKIICLLAIQILMLILTKSYNSLFLIISSVFASVISKIFVSKVFHQKQHFSVLVSIIQGILVGMLIPESFSPVTVFVCVFFSMLISKYLFGGFTFTWINPVLFSILILYFIGQYNFPDFLVTKDILMMKNPCLQLIENGSFPITTYDSSVTDFLNSKIFSLFKISIPEGYVSLFFDSHSVIPAFRFNFLTLISSIFIFGPDLAKSIAPFTFIIFYLIFVRIFSPLFTECVPFQGDMILSLLTSGTLFFAIFVINSYGIIPISIVGKFLYGLLAAILAFFIVGCGTSSIGMTFTFLICDIFSLFIQKWEENKNRRKIAKLVKNWS